MKTIKIFKKVICIVIASVAVLPLMAISNEDLLKRRAAERVGQLNDYISSIASLRKPSDREERQYYNKAALNLMVAKGEPYTEQGRRKEGVMMQTTSLRNKTPKVRTMKRYLVNLANLNYSDIKIESTEIADMRVSDLRKVPGKDNVYVCTCYFEQKFTGYRRDGQPSYQDLTRKKVECYVYLQQTEDGEEHLVLLGDVTALETERPSNMNSRLR